jgi:hypothetical protein
MAICFDASGVNWSRTRKAAACRAESGSGGDIQLGDEVSPAKQLAAQRSLALRDHREIGEVQDALVTPQAPARIRRSKEFAGAMHFVRDHQDLLVDRERRPSFE